MVVINTKKVKLSLITLALFNYYGFAIADNGDITELNTITVTSEQNEANIKDKKVAETVKTSKNLQKQQVHDSRDLVRYETGITVVETGRFGSSGYAIRGVDENRVAITVDGLHQAEALSSQGFKELFEGYGNFNNARNSVEMETLKQVTINKGANSVKVGSGALGGSVMFETKDARDFLLDKDYFYSIKGGLASADEQAFYSQTFAGRYKNFDLLAIYTRRNHHELQNFGYDSYDRYVFGKEREKADPYHIQKESTLLKIGFQPNEENRLSLTFDGYTNESKGHDYSYTLTPKSISDFGKENFVDIVGQRHTRDKSTRKNYAITFENFTQTPLWDTVKVTYSDQKIKNRARTEEYCRGDKCQDIANPIGFKVDGAKVVDSNGGDVDIYRDYDVAGLTKLRDSLGNVYNSGYNASNSLNSYLFDCSIYDCSGDITIHKIPDYGDHQNNHSRKVNIGLSDTTSERTVDGNKYQFDVSEKVSGGKTYKKVDVFKKYHNWLGHEVKQSSDDFAFVIPDAKGYLERDWKERDLDTDTKQVNLDFSKYLDIKGVTNDIVYGGVYKETQKRMVNRQGYDAKNPQWWADTYVQNCGKPKGYGDKTDAGNALKCPKVEDETSFLIPVKSKEGALYIADEIQFNDTIGIDFGYRYDRIKYKPNYIPGVSPKIPDGMVEGLFIPFKPVPPSIEKPSPYDNKYVDPQYLKDLADYYAGKRQDKPSPWGYDATNDPQYKKDLADYESGKRSTKPSKWDDKYPGRSSDPNYLKDLAHYNKVEEEISKVKEENKHNAEKNIEYFSKDKKFSSSSYALGVNLDPLDYLKIQVKYSKGFRAPTHEELYFTFRHPDFTIKPNVDLEPEIAKTKEIAFTFHKKNSFVTIGGFKTDYKNFLDLKYLGVTRVSINSKSALDFDIYQNVNRAKASVKGIEIHSLLSLGDIYDNLDGVTLGWKFTKQRGKVLTEKDGYVPMNAIQPTTSVYSLGYASPDGKFGGDVYIKHVSSKKSKDTYNMFWRNEQQQGDNINGKPVSDSSSHWLSNRYTTIDFIGYYRPIKDLTLRFGAYNITNQKYITWDSARSIRSFGTTNRINKDNNLGINRFNAPGRNFKLDVEYIF